VVTQKVAPQSDHGFLGKRLTVALTRVGEDRRLGVVFVERRLVTPDGWAPAPDVSYIREERLRPESGRRFGRMDLPPDLAIEIISPDRTVRELLEKCLRGDDRIDLDDMLPGFDLTVGGLFDSIVPDWLVNTSEPADNPNG
jgi:Uma2 family endonuclease